jgi:sugar lactone lactonase YvrE
MLLLAWMFLPGSSCLAQKTPPFVATAQTTITAYPPTPATGTAPTPVLQGAGFGTLAVNKFGDLFVGGYNSNTVVEFPAATMNSFDPVTATVPNVSLYFADTGGHAGAAAVDPNGNLIVSEVFSTVITMVPYVNGAYTPFANPDKGSSYSGSTPPVPPVCTGTVNNGVVTLTSTTACSYDFPIYYYGPGITGLNGSSTNSPTGGYYQVADLAFDPAGNSFIATFGDSNGNTNIFECSVACNYSGAPPVQVYEFTDPATPTNKDQNWIDSIAVDAADDIFIANNSNTVWEVVAGTPGAQTVLPIPGFIDAQGVAFDQAGNLYVTDNGTTSKTAGTVNGGIYEIPLENGALNPADMFMVFPLDTVSYCAGPNNTTVPCSYVGYAQPWSISDIGVAVDLHGNIFQSVDYNTVYKYTVGNASFPATALGSTSAPVTLTLTFSRSTPITLQSSSITSAGQPSAEFSIVTGTNGGTCVIGAPATSNAAGTFCTVVVQFTPAEPGSRSAILTLTDSAGDAVPITLSGVGTGQAITIDPGTLTEIGSGLKKPDAVAVDAAGNVFVADAGANAVYEYAGGSGAGTSVGSGLKAPAGLATDAAGNLYISDTGNDRVVMVPSNNGVLSTASQSTLLNNLQSPGQLAVDLSGTLYIPEAGANDVLAFAKPSGLVTSGLTTVLPIPNLNAPTAVAVDANDVVYVADKGNVVESADGVISNVGSNLNSPTSLAVDDSGSVLIADGGAGRIWRVPNENGVLTGSQETVVSSANSILDPYAVAVDAFGNVYATDSANAAAYALNRISGAIAFQPVNDLSSSPGQTAVLSSSGPADLTLNSPLFPALSASSPFSIPSSSDECSGMATLATGYSCTLEAYFAPGLGVGGAQSQTIDFSTGAQNTGAPSLQLSGTAVNELPANVTLVQTVPATGNASYGGSVTVQATVTPAPGSGATITPTGTVQFTVDGNYYGKQTLDSSGSASIAVTGLSGGVHSISASYSGDSIYAPASSSALTVQIVPASSATTLSLLGCAANPTSAEPANSTNTCDTVVMTATVVPSTPGALSGPVVFSSGSTALGTAYVSGVTSGSTTTYTAVLTTTGPTALAAGNYNVVATFAGNANYTGSASAAVPLIITLPTFTMAQTATSISSSATSPGSMTITTTSESGFTGAVNFSCSGLPAHATCQFIPDVLVLAQLSTSPIVVPPLQTKLTLLVNQAPIVTPTGIFWWSGLLLGLSLFGLASNRNARRRLLMQCVAGCLLLVSVAGVAACGTGSGTFKTPSGSSTVTITAVATPPTPGGGTANSANNVTQTMTFTLKVQ